MQETPGTHAVVLDAGEASKAVWADAARLNTDLVVIVGRPRQRGSAGPLVQHLSVIRRA